ncbi:hypothetical protein E8E13_009861 [Curvularia kusanoi]|uniref:Calcineurin-like phosphoesterase domain-containing protein n=1 Tax=Curvularia kusanoi TaxID=90978 RepID=A0A9P4TFC6_CURKU|nr:hypothetical protein E8E13_009861 [Curvularia kusanoi]
MKYRHLHWLVVTAAASPLLQLSRNSIADYPGLQFGADGKFSISVFSDMHLGETTSFGPGKGPSADLKTIGVMKSVLDNEKPNMVVLNGDLFTCEAVSSGDALRLTDQIAAPLVERNLPFAATFGNHDMSDTCDTRAVSEHMWSSIKGNNGQKLSFTTSSVPGPYNEVGTSNYFVPIYASKDATKIAMMLWFFDSKGAPCTNNTVDDKVLSWFTSTRDAIQQQQGRVVPSLAFVHIPLFITRAIQFERDPATAPGLTNGELIDHEGNLCDKDGKCKYKALDVSFLLALDGTKGLMAVFSGHNHGIDWCAKWSHDLPHNSRDTGSLNFCSNRRTGYGGYGDFIRGGRQIVVDEGRIDDKIVDTWVRLEDGRISGQVTLNSTFGKDRYPLVNE